MTDMHEARMAHLATIQELSTLVDSLEAPMQIMTGLGTDGIVSIAESDPQLLLTGLKTMHNIIGKQKKMINELTELWYEAMDDTSEVIDLVRKVTRQDI
jgi:hypothetical protein